MSQTLSLYRLQQIDSHIDRSRTRLTNIQGILADDTELARAQNQFNATKDAHQLSEESLVKAEKEVNDLRVKIEQTEASLYQGKGHTPKDLIDLQNDVAALKCRLVMLEEHQLNAMLAVEETSSAYQSAQEEILRISGNSQARNHGLLEEHQVLQREVEKLTSERSAASASIPSGTLDLYEKLRQQRRGIAVSNISDNACSSCGAGLSAALIQSSRAAGAMVFCPSCGRILYGN